MSQPVPPGSSPPQEVAEGLPPEYQAALLEMVTDLDSVTELLRHDVGRDDIERVVLKLAGAGRDEFTERVASLFRRVSGLLLVSRRLGDTLSLDVLLRRLVELISDFVGAERCTIFLHDARTDQLYTRIAMGVAGEIRFPSGLGIVGAAFRGGQAIDVPDAYADPRFNPDVDREQGFRTRNLLCVPLRHQREGKARVVGVVEAVNKRDGSFTADDARLLDILNSQAATALVNALLHEEVQQFQAVVDQSTRNIGSLLEVSKALAAEVDLDSLLEVILAKATEVLEAERGSFFLFDEPSRTLWSRTSKTLGRGEVRIPLGVGVAGHVAATLRPLTIDDAYADARFNPEVDRRTGFRTRSILCAPALTHAGRLIGVIQVLNKAGARTFTASDAAFLEAFASHAAIAVERARLVEAFVDKEKIEEALRLAHQIQMGMLPKPLDGGRRFELVAHLRPARSVGGDLYDFLAEPGRLWFLIADVSGKGIGAALFMAVTRTLFRAMAPGERSPAALLARMNRELSRDNERALFVTAFVACLELDSGELAFANAGHNPPFRVAADRAPEQLSGGHGVPLGVLPEAPYQDGRLRLAPGDGLFLYTDGVTEAMSPDGEQFTASRLEQQLRAGAGRELVALCLQAVEAFEAGAPQTDDIAVLWVRYLGG